MAPEIADFKPDLVLMDVVLGQSIDGTEVVRSIKGMVTVLHSSLPEDELETRSAAGEIAKCDRAEQAAHRFPRINPIVLPDDLLFQSFSHLISPFSFNSFASSGRGSKRSRESFGYASQSMTRRMRMFIWALLHIVHSLPK